MRRVHIGTRRMIANLYGGPVALQARQDVAADLVGAARRGAELGDVRLDRGVDARRVLDRKSVV